MSLSTLLTALPSALTRRRKRSHSAAVLTLDRSEFIELTAAQQPELFAFIEDICDRAGATMPHRVFVCADVNAGVFYETSVVSLFRPAKKNLLIGLGLVAALNRTELEAVLAHEFGHFSQRAMRLNHYLQLMTEFLDHRAGERGARLRRYLHRLDASLSRQLELRADRVALRLTGSDALIHALLRTDWADRCFSQTLYDLEQAAAQGLQTDDLFYHQERLTSSMRERLGRPDLGCPPELARDEQSFTWVFNKEENEDDLAKAGLWASHPPHRLREEMARKNYRRSQIDERSAWTLFRHPEALRRALTKLLYQVRWQKTGPSSSVEKMQAYLDGEHAEVLLSVEERAVYGHRFLEPGDLESAAEEALAEACSDEELSNWLHELLGPRFSEAADRVSRHINTPPPSYEPQPARPLRSAASARLRDEKSVATASEHSAASDRLWLANFDRQLLTAALQAAAKNGPPAVDELLARYRFHLHLQELLRWMRRHNDQLPQVVDAIKAGALTEELVDQIFEVLTALHQGLATGLLDAPPTPTLHGLPETQPLSMLALSAPLIDDAPLKAGHLDSSWLSSFLEQWQQAQTRLDHLRRKSLGALLLYQRQLIAPWVS